MDPMDFTTIEIKVPSRVQRIVESAASLGGVVLTKNGEHTVAMGQHVSIAKFEVFIGQLNELTR